MRILIFNAFFLAFFQAQTGQNRFSQLLDRCNLVFSIVLCPTMNKNVLHSSTRSNVFSLTCLLMNTCKSCFLSFLSLYFSMILILLSFHDSQTHTYYLV